MPENDQELLVRLKKDDVAAYEEIYSKYADRLFFYAMNIFKQQEICEDILQNVFIYLWEKRKELEITHLKAYLHQAVRFQILKVLRNQRFTQEDVTRLNLVDASLNASKKMEFDELEALVKSLVDNLSPRCREIFIMSRFEEKSNKQISVELGLSTQSVKNQISKALKSLREQVSPEQLVIYHTLMFVFCI
ncbi:RNA polymerase sigma factor [Flagellimonas iocasae]|uniref:RNA polymerase sigma factor n=1 Tax=Flagellimonas iocasae TaxID=2055905 RepID=A0ABW4XVS5_9FLAO